MSETKLSRVRLRNFTVFENVDVSLSPQLNVIVGENGTGKSHLLKLLYSAAAVGRGPVRGERTLDGPRKSTLQIELAEKLVGVFRPWNLGRLVRRVQGTARADVKVSYRDNRSDLAFEFGTRSKNEVVIDRLPKVWSDSIPVYFPTRELLTIYPGFVSLWEGTAVPFEETWRDTCLMLGRPLARGPRAQRVSTMLAPIEEALGGKIVLEGDEFYLRSPGLGNIESSLLAEGLRKFGMLAQLIANGTLLGSGLLFWDEPEANLNPRAIRDVARVIASLSSSGVQVVIATHSLFLLRELAMLNIEDARYIGLHRDSEGVTATVGTDMDSIGDIAALDEALAQSDRFLNLV